MELNDYLTLFPGASREKTRFMALAQAVLQQVLDLVPVTLGALEGYSFLTAEGQALDDAAAVFGLKRSDTTIGDSCTDADFREYLLAKLALWTWDGTNRSMQEILEKAGIDRQMRDRLDESVEIVGAGHTPRADYRKLFPIPAGISWMGIMPRPPIVLDPENT